MKGRRAMEVSCKVCGGLLHALIEPYCYTDKDFLKAIEKYKKKPWLHIDVLEREKYDFVQGGDCCERGIGWDKKSDKKIEIKDVSQPKVVAGTLF